MFGEIEVISKSIYYRLLLYYVPQKFSNIKKNTTPLSPFAQTNTYKLLSFAQAKSHRSAGHTVILIMTNLKQLTKERIAISHRCKGD